MQIPEFIIASAALTIMPGPDILYVLSQSVMVGRRAGISVALGLCSGIFVHTAAVALGLALLITSSPLVFNIIKYAGVGYLVYMGVMSYLNRNKCASPTETNDGEKTAADFKKLYKTGIMMNLLNPKVIMFFLAFLPQFVNTASDTPRQDVFLLGTLFALQAIVVFSSVSVAAGYISEKFSIDKLLGARQGVINAVVYLLIALLFIISI